MKEGTDNTETAAAPSDVQRLRNDLVEARAKLSQAYQLVSIGRLLSGIVHEINTPIGSIMSNNEVSRRMLDKLQVLLQQASAGERALDIVDTLRGLAQVDKLACERISGVIRSLKSNARTDRGELRKEDLNEILRNALKLSGCEFRRRITVDAEFGDIPAVECYAQLMNQVFLNLLVNAGQAIEGEGRISVRTWQEDGNVHVTIADTGKGIPPEIQERIFSPGFTTKPVGVGTGLGLAITHQIVSEAHGGSIRFESQLGHGTTFHIVLPVEHKGSRDSGSFTDLRS